MIIKKNHSSFKITIITLVFPYPKRGIMPGVENYVESFAVPLKKLGYDVRIITTYWNGKNKFDKEFLNLFLQICKSSNRKSLHSGIEVKLSYNSNSNI
ncbi:hypothetical protein LCGC14_1602960 [marine sediment metagenome]|uniref:Uncharacterized protein n=1 Tax=marine sediment metagenome TaxID=412755 RepID=A0A0F9KRB6_9ZZZZ